jgi:hypothetical protein
MEANETGPPGNGKGGCDTARFQKTKETTAAHPTITGNLCKQISHMVSAAEGFAMQRRKRAWACAMIRIGIWWRRVEIRRERRRAR